MNFRSRQEMSFLERKEKENCPSLTYGKKREGTKMFVFHPFFIPVRLSTDVLCFDARTRPGTNASLSSKARGLI